MELYEAIRKRISVREFRPGHVPDEVLFRVLKAGTMAPSAENSQPWEFILIRDPQLRRELTDIKIKSRVEVLRAWRPTVSVAELEQMASRGRTAMETADLLVAVCYRNVDSPVEMGEMRMSLAYSSAWTCIENIWLAAAAEGLGISQTFYPHFVYQQIKKLLGLPSEVELASILRVGYPPRPVKGTKKTVKNLEDKLHVNQFGTVWKQAAS